LDDPLVTLNINIAELTICLSIVLRLSVILFMLPIFTAGQIPNNIKVCTILALAFVLFPFVRHDVQPVALNPGSLFPIVVGELVFGIVFSLSMLLVISAFSFAGELISFEMGLGFAQVADPQTGAESSILSVFAQLIALMVFFALNAHHVVLKLIIESFRTIPVGTFAIDAALFTKIVILSGQLFVLAIKLAAPVISVLILTQLAMGLMSKFAPQINILTTSFPLTIGVGLVILSFTVVIWRDMAARFFVDLFHFLGNLAR
jgi:flagellar biosynthesis protein FliR